jgi:hypothetical protein
MDRRIALVVVASVLLLVHSTSAQKAPGASHGQLGTTAVPGQSFRSHTPTPPPPPQPPSRTVAPTLPPSPPGLIPTGIAQLPSNGVVQTFTPALNPRSGKRFIDGRFVDNRSIDPRFARDVFRAGPFTYTPRYGNRLDGGYGGYGSIGGGYYDSTVGTAGSPQGDLRGEAPAEFGFLRMSVQPDAAQIYIDGFYVSTAGSFAGGGPARAIESGPHRVEIRADGYETATFDVRVVPNETISYSRDLTRAEEPRQARNVTPAVPKTFYVIPKCYAGDKKPSDDQLPKGCLARNVRAIPPVVTAGPQSRTRPAPAAN